MAVINRPLQNSYIFDNIEEAIITLTEHNNLIKVCVAPVYKDTKGMLDGNIFEEFVLVGDAFEDLMEANPSWAPNKPSGTYRNEDLWRFIDIMRASGKDRHGRYQYIRPENTM